jgi:hypothetical protein
MPAYHLLRCMVALGGGSQPDTIVYRDRTRPIVFPELPILQHIHGEDAITEIHVVGQWDAPNDEVLARIQAIYDPDIIKEVFPGARPRLPLSDPSIPKCTQPVYKPRPTRPDSPDPRLRPLDQFTMTSDTPVLEAPPLPAETEPTPDEIAAHAQDDDQDDMGLVPDTMVSGLPRPEDLPHIVRDTLGRGSSNQQTAATLPDVNAGGSHAPGHRPGAATSYGQAPARAALKKG